MAETLDRPKAPTRRRIDVDAYYRMGETGILPDGCRVELIDGDIIDRVPIGSPHAGRTIRLTRAFALATASGAVALAVQTPLRLDRHNEPQPDLMLLRPRDDDYTSGHPSAAEVLLLIEVSDTSLAYDRTTKLGLYARFGVPEVWIVDVAGRAVEVYRNPDNGAFAHRERLTEGRVAPSLVPEIVIDIAELTA